MTLAADNLLEELPAEMGQLRSLVKLQASAPPGWYRSVVQGIALHYWVGGFPCADAPVLGWASQLRW